MRIQLAHPLALILSLSPSILAQSPSPAYLPANEPNATVLAADRTRLVRDMYQLEPPATDKLAKDVTALVPFQEKYLKEISKTVYRTELAITLTANDSNIAEAEKPNRIAGFQDQLNHIYGRAPLSLANVIKMADAGLAPDKVKAAHDKIAARFADRLKGAALDVARIDALVMPPVHPGKKPEIVTALSQYNPPPAPAPTSPLRPATQAPPPAPNPNQPANPQAPQPTKPAVAIPPPQPAAPPPPPRDIKPAPPEAEWPAYLEKSATKFALTPEQKKIAEKALDQCKNRAVTYREKTKPDYESAAKLDPKDKSNRVAELNKPLDVLFDELTQRVEALATAEQKAKFEKPQAAPATPAPTTPAPATPAPAPKTTAAPVPKIGK